AHHPTLTKVDDAELRDELVSSKEEIERLTGVACTSIAYPKGRADERVVRAAEAAGYAAGAALEGATDLAAIVLAWPRSGFRGDASHRISRLKCSRNARRGRWGRLRRPAAKVVAGPGNIRGALVGL